MMMNRLNIIALTAIMTLTTICGFSQVKEEGDNITVQDSTSFIPLIDYQGESKRYLLKDVTIRSSKFVNSNLILSSAGIVKGDSIYIPSDYISNALQILWGRRYYSNMKVYVRFDGDDAYLDLDLQERPRVSVWEFKGATKGEREELNEWLKLNKRVELSDYALGNSVDIIKKYYAEKGYINTEVAIRQKNDTAINNFVIVTFDIDKKEKIKIKKINFAGNTDLSEKSLKKSMKETKEKNLWNILKSAKYSEKTFETSKEEVVDYMLSKGYRDAKIVSDTIYEINKKRIGLNIDVYEGEKYYFRNITWVGNSVEETDKLRLILGVKPGDLYDQKNLDARLGLDGSAAMEGELNVSSLYKNRGYLAFQIEPVETAIVGDSIDIEIRMSEGKQYTINKVEIAGNNRVHDKVIRRELYVRPGELYDESMLINTMRQIANLKHFNQEKTLPDISPVTDDLVDLHFNLEEQASDQFEFSGGWGGSTFVLSASITFNNVSLRKLKEKESWKPYPSGDNQQLNLTVQSNGSYYQAYSLSFLEPWLGGKKPNSLQLSIYYSAQNDSYYDSYYSYYSYSDDYSSYYSSDQTFKTIGVSLAVGKRLSWPDPYFTLTGELSYKAYLLNDWDYFMISDGNCNTIAFAGTISRNSMDQQLYPRRGSEMFLKLTATPPWSLMNKSKDWSDEDMTTAERYKWVEYYKVNGMARFFLPMTKSNKLVLMTRGEFGVLGEYNEYNPSPFEGFAVGGDGISGYTLYGLDNIGLRGYDDYALTPYATSGTQATVYSKFTAELRYPVILKPSASAYVLLFAEAGNAGYSWDLFSPFELKRSLGVGARIYLPIIGMFGLDWGYGFDAVTGSSDPSGSQFHFSMGQTF